MSLRKKVLILILTLTLLSSKETGMPSYTIKPGDTLSKISRDTGYSVDELANYNRIDPNMIMVGQQLRIPYRYPGEEMSVAVPTSRTTPVMSNEYEFLLESISKDKQVPKDVLEDLMENIGIWESDFNKKQIIADAKQRSKGKKGFFEGPGRGAFQFEILDKGGSGRSVDARQRLKNYYEYINKEQPKWLKELPDNYDPSNLTLDQQKMLFLGDARMGPGDLSKLVEDDKPMTVGDWWAKFHKIKGVSDQDIKKFNEQAKINRLRKLENQPINTNSISIIR